MHLDGGTNIGNVTSHSLLGHHTHSTRLPIVVHACFRACAPLSLSLSLSLSFHVSFRRLCTKLTSVMQTDKE